ncbi:hypothetical protein RIF24_15900 [Exiguobacterium acetylicum]|uniref:hypothetical protein n=1 Tax=Exiguobacterium acetylicum TaxID=41170 RepID=UPI003977CD4E
MYRNRSPNLAIILLIILATSFPVPHSHATTGELEIPDPLTSSFCEETLNDPKKKDLLEKKEIGQCKELLEQKQTSPTEIEDPSTPETPPTEIEDPSTPETPPTEIEDPSTPETPPTESEDPPTPETPPTESEDPPTPETPPTESEDPPTPETPPTENEDPPTPETPSTEIEDPSTPETPPTESEDPPTPETPPTENEDPQTLETPSSDEETSTAPEPAEVEEDEVTNLPHEIDLNKSKSRNEENQSSIASIIDVKALGTSSLEAQYNATTKVITLKNTVSSLIKLDIFDFSKKYIIFDIPPNIMENIDTQSAKISVGSGQENVDTVVDRSNNRIYAEVNSFLKLVVLGNERFNLSFKIENLPIGNEKTYTFRSGVTEGLLVLSVLSSGTATDTLEFNTKINLTVPATLDFGSHVLTGQEKIIPRLSPMTIEISHENATGYNWKLQASLPSPLKSSSGDVIKNVLYFKTSSKTQLLQETAIEIASGTMSISSNQTPLTYAENEGIVLDLSGKYPRPTSYSTSIQWSLINAP